MTHQSPITSNTPFVPAQPLSSLSGGTLPAIIEQLPPDSDHPPQTQFTRARQRAFLQRLADSGEVRVAARASNVSHQTVYRLRRTCAAFRTGWDAALLIARERAEEELATRALHGVEEEVYYHGELVAKRRRHDSRLLLAHLARLDRLAERADVAALADVFDDVLEAFARAGANGAGEGEAVELPEVAPATAPETSPEPCNMRSMSPVETPLDAGPGAGEAGAEAEGEEGAAIPATERRLRAMWAARPDGVKLPHELAREQMPGPDGTTYDSGEIEAAQLIAFEVGAEDWWEVMPDELVFEQEPVAGAGAVADAGKETGGYAGEYAGKADPLFRRDPIG